MKGNSFHIVFRVYIYIYIWLSQVGEIIWDLREPQEVVGSLGSLYLRVSACMRPLRIPQIFQCFFCRRFGAGSDARPASPGAQSALETAAALRNGSGTENEKDYIGLRV